MTRSGIPSTMLLPRAWQKAQHAFSSSFTATCGCSGLGLRPRWMAWWEETTPVHHHRCHRRLRPPIRPCGDLTEASIRLTAIDVSRLEHVKHSNIHQHQTPGSTTKLVWFALLVSLCCVPVSSGFTCYGFHSPGRVSLTVGHEYLSHGREEVPVVPVYECHALRSLPCTCSRIIVGRAL